MVTIRDLGDLWPALGSPTSAAGFVAEAWCYPELAGLRKHVWIAALWFLYPLIVLAACILLVVVLVYVVHPLREP